MQRLFWVLIAGFIPLTAVFILLSVFMYRCTRESARRNRELCALNQALAKSNSDLQRFVRSTIARESRMIELKQRIKELEDQIKKGLSHAG